MMRITGSIQDYLKVIYELNHAGGPAGTTEVAERLSVSPASVTGMLQKLASAKRPLVIYRKHQGARLTRDGRLAALEVIRRHRLIESWLVQSLGYTWDQVHQEADELEHVISGDLERRISQAMGNPQHDPHGEPIPSPALVMPPDATVALSTIAPPRHVIVRRVEARAPDFLRHLEGLGLRLGTKLTVLGISEYDRVMHVRIERSQEPVTLGPAITSHIFVEQPGAHRSRRGNGNRRAAPRAGRVSGLTK